MGPAPKRAIDETVAALKKAGHEVVDMDFDQAVIWELCRSFMQTALLTHKGRVETVKGELVIPEFLIVDLLSKLPSSFRPILTKIFEIRGQRNLHRAMSLEVHRGSAGPLL